MSPKLLNILLVLIPVILYYGVFEPLYTGNPGIVLSPETSITGLQSKNVQYTNTINLVSSVATGIKKISNDYSAIESTSTKKVEAMLPDTIDPIRLRNEVISIADGVGIAINGVKVVEDNSKSTVPGVGMYMISFDVRARYQALKELLKKYEKNTRFYNIDSLKIARQDLKGLSVDEIKSFDKEALQVSVIYRVYYLK